MGWDGTCHFEEKVDGHWLPLGKIEIQAIVLRAAHAADAPFIDADDDQPACVRAGVFNWSDYRTASENGEDLGSYRTVDEALEQIRQRGEQRLAAALSDTTRCIRADVCVCH